MLLSQPRKIYIEDPRKALRAIYLSPHEVIKDDGSSIEKKWYVFHPADGSTYIIPSMDADAIVECF